MINQMNKVRLEASWKNVLFEEFSKSYMQNIKSSLILEKQLNKIIYPKGKDIFRAFELTPIHKVKVVILGQDPYHGHNQANGLCFSVPYDVPLPPSLINIYRELYNDLGIEPAKHGLLDSWAKEGVLLLNRILTVEHGIAGTHRKIGWEIFTDQDIKDLNNHIKNSRISFPF